MNIVIAGLGGQGVLKASDILADAAFRDGFDVKKAEVHGMSQRGGSVTSDVRFGKQVLSPMVPPGEADFLVVLSDEEVENNRHRLRPAGVLIQAADLEGVELPQRKSLNVAILGRLSRHLPVSRQAWEEAIRSNLESKLHEANLEAFRLGSEN